MPWWLWVIGIGGAAAIALVRASAAPRVHLIQVPQTATEPDGQWQSQTITMLDRWQCPRTPGAAAAMIPDIGSIVPSEVVQAGGPIATAIVAGVDTVRSIFEAIGKRTCTVLGGRYVVPQGARWVAASVVLDVRVSLRWEGRSWQWRWSWSSVDVGDTGTLGEPVMTHLNPEDTAGYTHLGIDYLHDGGEPKGTIWPHYPIDPAWQDPPGPQQPQAEVVRSEGGTDLLLGVWLPSRSALYATVTAPRKGHRHRLVARPQWRIQWRAR